MQEFLKNNIVQVIILIFLAGSFYSRFMLLEKDVEVLEDRLSKKIKIINRIEKRLDNLEKCK